MAEKEENRRVKYTKRVIKEALIELMANRQVGEISVKKLCEQADVNRSTFYAHYGNPMDVMWELEEEVFTDLQQSVANHGQCQDKRAALESIMQAVLEYVQERRQTFLVLFAQDNLGDFQDQLFVLTQGQKTHPKNMTQEQRDYQRRYVFYGNVAVIKRWLEKEDRESVKEMAKLIAKWMLG
ncbi:TetR/AcrR family transcriptional regulator [Limosilactobacillus fermentum]|uniref:TetR/AcrR family transcriptional regulator n=1 Tax=Limosilactobacillus fermentum TaxID=1613 RepID=UPI00128BA9CB|nr:TetR/AcrR family transcriptional regulator [Limosilactobacillus fermentum]MCD5424152.1 TetR/AcrR family transcriptional regulator [Limosilactobacillus fermentum]MPW03778.1 TetR/AcrR family transcriptional regulator [Limosilactobacillus fermentum]